MLDRAGAYALQRSADALVLITSRNTSEATSKLFEYLAAGRPIVALAENNEAERIIRETNTGVAVPPDDVDAITAALRRVVSGELAREYAARNLERFTYPGPAEAMAELIETAIRRRVGS
jgi:glycosyltransferase involved in cell wall biosynthesis